MPNHVTNILVVSGDDEQRQAMLEAIKQEKYGLGCLDFNKVIPMPEHIFQGNLGQAEREQYGSDNWYDWSIANWGTKWNSYGYHDYTEKDFDGATLTFDIAWSSPQPVIAALAEKYPNLSGKKALRALIYKLFPKSYGRYIEVFGGGGWVLFGKLPEKKTLEVYNDFNGNLTNLFYCVKTRTLAFLKQLGFLPLNSRHEFNVLRRFFEKNEFDAAYLQEELELAQHHLPEPDYEELRAIMLENAQPSDVWRAAAFFKLIRHSYGSGWQTSTRWWPHCKRIWRRRTSAFHRQNWRPFPQSFYQQRNNKQPPHSWKCKEEHTMKIIEIKGSIAEDGSILLPPGVLESMSMAIGDTVHLAYLSHHPVKQTNSYGEFFITKDGIDHVSEPVEAPDTAQLSVPHALLEAAGIPLDDDLDITVGDGSIMLSGSNPPRRAWGVHGGNWFPPVRRTVSEASLHFPQKMCAPMGGDEDE